jgi:hypothetical protein
MNTENQTLEGKDKSEILTKQCASRALPLAAFKRTDRVDVSVRHQMSACVTDRSTSQKSTRAPLSPSPYAISFACHQLFIGTAMAPIEVAAMNVSGHSG